MKLQAIFDHRDRLYRCGDVISGSVVVEAEHDCTCSEIWITYRWRTHGKGDRDQGEENRLTLARERSFRAGECSEFPFHFAAPNGPITYHGCLLNVDWYLTAHVRSSPLGPYFYFKSEQDFLLQAGDSTEVPPPSNDLLEVKPPGLWSRVRNFLFLAWMPVFAFLLLVPLCEGISTALLKKSLYGSELFWAFIIFLFTLGLLAAVAWTLFRNAYRLKLKLGAVWVRPASVYRGSEVCCHVDFAAKRGFHLRSMMASISARERISRRVGTTTATEFHVFNEKSYSRPFDEDLSEGRWIAFDCALPVGPDAPPSFSSPNNALEWIVTMKAELKGWPSWEKTFPITVLPLP